METVQRIPAGYRSANQGGEQQKIRRAEKAQASQELAFHNWKMIRQGPVAFLANAFQGLSNSIRLSLRGISQSSLCDLCPRFIVGGDVLLVQFGLRRGAGVAMTIVPSQPSTVRLSYRQPQRLVKHSGRRTRMDQQRVLPALKQYSRFG